MYWMQNAMKKDLRRRQQSQSPSSSESSSKGKRSLFGSKHKKRALWKESSATEGESLCSQSSVENNRKAAWRVENIRKAPPKEEEWWEETGCESNVGKDYEDAYCDDGYADRYGAIVIKSLPEQKRFRNCGLETWQQARKEWKKRTVEIIPPRPTPAEYVKLVKGLTRASGQRTYELPRKMALSDLIYVYNDIWEGQGI